jgi:hypothetical protein
VSDLPTDAEGNNLYGNSMQNLYNGGLMAMQGKDLFYINPQDGGALYCRAGDGTITKLTDFPVANLNVSGERLIFTDLENCMITRENGGVEVFSATNHLELFDEAGEDGHIVFGGNLYSIEGIKSFCAGDISYEELIITGFESEDRYLAPILMEGGNLLVITASPDDAATDVDPMSASGDLDLTTAIRPLSTDNLSLASMVRPMSRLLPELQPSKPRNPGKPDVFHTANSVHVYDANNKEITNLKLDTSKGDIVVEAKLAGNSLFVEPRTDSGGSDRPNAIIEFDPVTGEPRGTIEGHSLQSNGDKAFFKNGKTLFESDPATGKITQISSTPVDSPTYKVLPDGTVEYGSRDPNTGELVPIRAEPKEEGGYGRSVNNGPWLVEKAKFIAASVFAGEAYVFNDEEGGWCHAKSEYDVFNTDNREGMIKLNKIIYTPIPWAREARVIGENGVQWVPPGELGGLFSGGTGSTPPSTSQPAPTTEPPTEPPSEPPTEPASEPASEPPTEPKVSLDGTWVNVNMPQADYIIFSGNQVDWRMMGRTFRSGTFELQGDSINFNFTQSGPSVMRFSRSGDRITIQNVEYRLDG